MKITKEFNPPERTVIVQVGAQAPHCPACGSNNAMLHVHATFESTILKCRDCAHMVTNPHINYCKTFDDARTFHLEHNLAWRE